MSLFLNEVAHNSIANPVTDQESTINVHTTQNNKNEHMTTSTFFEIDEKLASMLKNVAIDFSNGQYEQAQTVLAQHLKETRGETEKIVWYLLLDLYKIQQNTTQLEKLTGLFAKKFGVSPPSLIQPSSKNEYVSFSGRNVIMLEGDLDKSIADKSKDFLKVVKEQNFCKIDCSQVDIKKSTIEGLTILLETMRNVRKMKAKAILVGDDKIANVLRTTLQDEETANQSIFWLLLLELLQWQRKEEEFDGLAFNFASTFDMSPPEFDPNYELWQEEGHEKQIKETVETVETPSSPPLPPTLLVDKIIDEWLTKLSEWMSKNKEEQVELTFQHVERMSLNAAKSWYSWTHKNLAIVQRLHIVQPNYWVLMIMDMANLLSIIKVISKNG